MAPSRGSRPGAHCQPRGPRGSERKVCPRRWRRTTSETRGSSPGNASLATREWRRRPRTSSSPPWDEPHAPSSLGVTGVVLVATPGLPSAAPRPAPRGSALVLAAAASTATPTAAALAIAVPVATPCSQVHAPARVLGATSLGVIVSVPAPGIATPSTAAAAAPARPSASMLSTPAAMSRAPSATP